ncbi:MAG TPA: DNA helicase [Pseudomonadales bacterium]|nr:DNA helicase [Pseudomonadales bacterium]
MKLSAPIFILKHRAKALSRSEGIPLHAALDRIANDEGFAAWSLLAAKAANDEPTGRSFAQLVRGELVLIAARPGQGKTLLALDWAIRSMQRGDSAAFFTLDLTAENVAERLASIGFQSDRYADRLLVDTSDRICADYVVERLAAAAPGTFVVIDYLQMLDQKRTNAELMSQVRTLATFARERQLIVACISQVDRKFDGAQRAWPMADDVRLPNPLDLRLFDRMCFLNRGEIRLVARTRA